MLIGLFVAGIIICIYKSFPLQAIKLQHNTYHKVAHENLKSLLNLKLIFQTLFGLAIHVALVIILFYMVFGR